MLELLERIDAGIQQLVMIGSGLQSQFRSKTIIPANNERKHKK